MWIAGGGDMRGIMKIISGLIMCVFATKAVGGREMIEVPILELIAIVWVYIYGLMLIINWISGNDFDQGNSQ